MAFYLTKPLNIPLGRDVTDVRQKLLKALGLREKELISFSLNKQSVDARDKNNVHFVCSYVVETTRAPHGAMPYLPPIDVLQDVPNTSISKHCVVVGAGPAGLFAALYLAKSGAHVTVIERGSDISVRQRKVAQFFNGGQFAPECNVQFGLGGAGTFSDGKLTTGISSPLTYSVFQQFVRSGAPQDILTSSLPHIGTDKLVDVVANIKQEIKSYGGEFLFDTTVTDFITTDQRVTGVVLSNGQKLISDCTLLACGHSARDTFKVLAKHGADIVFKPFAVGLRIEHSRDFINTAQYGALYATHRDLPTASYKLVYNGQKHSCYSFCMCPGGIVVAANSEPDTVVVNGMSNYLRDGRNSNSALVVNVTAQDVESYGFGNGSFAGVEFQRHLERKAYQLAGGNYLAPCQNVVDFIANKTSAMFEIAPTYPRGVQSVNLRQLLPDEISQTICDALDAFDKKIVGFGSSGVFTGVESRTSSPVRIVRDESFQSNLQGLYPVGEGAGYAGGIVSSAVDGLRVAMSIMDKNR